MERPSLSSQTKEVEQLIKKHEEEAKAEREKKEKEQKERQCTKFPPQPLL